MPTDSQMDTGCINSTPAPRPDPGGAFTEETTCMLDETVYISKPLLKSKRLGFVVGYLSFVNPTDKSHTRGLFLVTRQHDYSIAVDRFGVRFYRDTEKEVEATHDAA